MVFSRNGLRKLLGSVVLAIALCQLFCQIGYAEEHTVYGVYNALYMGNPNETPRKDFYLSLGSKSGARNGSVVEVFRKILTHDLLSRQLQKDMLFPIARLKIIHAEDTGAIAKLEKLFDAESTPVIVPRAVMVGDIVRLADR